MPDSQVAVHHSRAQAGKRPSPRMRPGPARRAGPTLFAICLSITLVQPLAVFAQSPVYRKNDTWAETILASRKAYAARWQHRLGQIRFEPWHTAEASRICSLREPFDLSALDKQGKPIWEPRPELLDGVVHYDLSNHGISQQRRLPCGDDAQDKNDERREFDKYSSPASLLHVREVTCSQPTTVNVWLGAEWGLELWLNGRCLISDPKMGNGLLPEPDQASVKLPLAAGTNQLVLRCLDVRRSGFYFSTVDADQVASDPIESLLEYRHGTSRGTGG